MEGLGLFSLCCLTVMFGICNGIIQRIELSAFEYKRRFEQPLMLGKCPDKLISYPNGVGTHRCTYPNRPGNEMHKKRKVHSKINVIIKDPTELMKHVGVCDYKSAEYFGLMNDRKDCLGNEIASKLSFRKKHVSFLYFEHFRPSVDMLLPSDDLDVPDSFTHHYNNTYYTEQIGIGTEEIIVVEMQFSSELLSNKTIQHFSQHSSSLSAYMAVIGSHIGLPKKVKVIRLSTADMVFNSKVFKGIYSLEEANRFVRQCERRISRIRHELSLGRGTYHLKYGFRQYEVAPIALPLRSPVSETQKRDLWENVNLLQVKANRVYVTYKRFRKSCKKINYRFCPYIKHTLRELKKLITLIHTQRRDWSQLPYEKQASWIKQGYDNVKLYKKRLHITTKALKKWLNQQRRYN